MISENPAFFPKQKHQYHHGQLLQWVSDRLMYI